MDYFSCPGPIDPQIEKDKRLVPALSYLNQFERLNKKAQDGNLTAAEYALLSKLDLGELYQFEQAGELSVELLVKWLSSCKFKAWVETETRGVEVTERMKEERAQKIDAAGVAAHEFLERELKKLGVEIKPRYSIEPPFGQRPTRIHNHSRLTTAQTHRRRS